MSAENKPERAWEHRNSRKLSAKGILGLAERPLAPGAWGTTAAEGGLYERWCVPPFSVLDRRQGHWQARKRLWLALGIDSEVGRGHNLVFREHPMFEKKALTGTSVFDPVLCEVAYTWFSRPGDRVLDPFAGGSVRGVVASHLQREYYGVDLREEQVAANRAQLHICGDPAPVWEVGDAARLRETAGHGEGGFDLVFTCPPYAGLERYSDDPADLSAMRYPEHVEAVRAVAADCHRLLAENRFAVWVTSDVRDWKGEYFGLVADTICAFKDAGFRFHNDLILIDIYSSAAMRAGNSMRATRKTARVHQYVLVFVKGDPKAAADRLNQPVHNPRPLAA